MTDTTVHGWVPILKQEKQADGTLIVEGLATDSGIDRDQQIADPGWLSKAMPEWFRSGGNIREQHDGKRAAGVAVEYSPGDEGHRIRAKIVDPVTVAKIEHGVLKGFSFGARNARVTTDKSAAGGRIVDGQIYEVSVVDRPANPRCTLTVAKADAAGDLQLVDEPELVERAPTPADMAADLARIGKRSTEIAEHAARMAELLKADGDDPDDDEDDEDQDDAAKADDVAKRDVSGKERKKLAREGEALPDGSYPIANVGDLKNAIQAFGRAKDKARAKAHIVRRARALGRTDLLPDDWGVKKALDAIDDLIEKTDDGDLLKFVDAAGAAQENADVAAGQDVIAGIAGLIASEARDLAAGHLGEIDDIRLLIDAACSLTYFIQCEAREIGRQTPPGGAEVLMPKSDNPTEPETPAGGDSAEVTKTDAPAETGEVTKTELTALIEDAITKAVQPYQEAVESLKGELAEVKATPIPGGPVRTRTTTATEIATKADGHRRQARYFQQMAEQTTSGDLAKGYRDLANQELAKADALTS